MTPEEIRMVQIHEQREARLAFRILASVAIAITGFLLWSALS